MIDEKTASCKTGDDSCDSGSNATVGDIDECKMTAGVNSNKASLKSSDDEQSDDHAAKANGMNPSTSSSSNSDDNITRSTPYSGGVFMFDIYIPNDYPQSPPRVQFLTTGGGSVKFGPNLYNNGKVCLSLLGTWSGPSWNGSYSSLHQVLVSIQSFILGEEHPYTLEPGFGGWEPVKLRTRQGSLKEGKLSKDGKGNTVVTSSDGTTSTTKNTTLPPEMVLYEDRIRLGTIRYAMLEPLNMICTSQPARMKEPKEASAKTDDEYQEEKKDSAPQPPMPISMRLNAATKAQLRPFEDVLKVHFYHNGKNIMKTVHSWLKEMMKRKPVIVTGSSAMLHRKSVLSSLYSANAHPRPPTSTNAQPPPSKPSNGFVAKNIQRPERKESNTKLVTALQKLAPALKSKVDQMLSHPPALESVKFVNNTKDGKEDRTSAVQKNESDPNLLDSLDIDDLGPTPEMIIDNKSIKNKSGMDLLREQMNQAATNKNYILAGQIQKEISDAENYDSHIVELKEKMEEHAAKGDYINAGKVQQELKSFEKSNLSSTNMDRKYTSKEGPAYSGYGGMGPGMGMGIGMGMGMGIGLPGLPVTLAGGGPESFQSMLEALQGIGEIGPGIGNIVSAQPLAGGGTGIVIKKKVNTAHPESASGTSVPPSKRTKRTLQASKRSSVLSGIDSNTKKALKDDTAMEEDK